MLIDWFTVLAQIVNFLVLVWLLKRFLFGRILRAIDDRDRRIADNVTAADTREHEAQRQIADYADKLRSIEDERETILAQARLEAESKREAMLDTARRQIAELDAKWQQDLARDRQEFLSELRRRAATEVLKISRRVITDIASRDLESCAIDVFLRKIRLLDSSVWDHFVSRDLLVRSALALTDDDRDRITAAVEERIGTHPRLRFETGEDVGLGLELCGDGWRIGWNSNSYLEALEESLNEALTKSN